MKTTKSILSLLLAAGMAFSLSACGDKQEISISGSGDTITIDDLALRPDGEAGHLYENDGLKLLIPLEYDALLITETPEAEGEGKLFSVSEKASVEAAKAAGMDYDGVG